MRLRFSCVIMETMKPSTYEEGPQAWREFDAAVRSILSVPREEIARREAAYRKATEENPKRRGPKRKAKPAACPDAGA